MSYYKDEFEEKGKGICGLVGNAFKQSDKGSFAVIEETLFHMDMTNFLSKFTLDNQLKIISLVNQSRNIQFHTSRVPRSIKDINSFYMKSQHSIYKNIPIPKIISYDNHACVSIEHVINNVMSIGLPLPMIRSSDFNNIEFDNSCLLRTEKTKDILMQTYKKFHNYVDPYVIFLVIWSDDFEVNQTRKNKSSTWIKTVTFVHENNDNLEDNEYTYALCLGNKKSSHFLVNRWYGEELIRLNEVIYKYSAILGEFIPIVTRVLVMSADRPERCSLNDIASYSSNSTKRWMFSNGSDPHKMASCIKCFGERLSQMFEPKQSISQKRVCRTCSDFDFLVKKTTNKFLPPKDYPNSDVMERQSGDKIIKVPSGREPANKLKDGYLYPIRITYDTLSHGLRYALFNYLKQTWRKKETVVYLKLLGMKDSTINDMIEKALLNQKKTKTVEEAIFQTNMPPMWTTILTLDQFIETPMHHLFEGLVKSSIEILMLYMKFHKKWSAFARLTNDILNDVSSLNLNYCSTDSFNNEEDFKTGGWLAENYVAFSRIMLIILGHFEEFIEPNELGFYELQVIFQTLFALLSRLMSNKIFDNKTIDNYNCFWEHVTIMKRTLDLR